MVYRRRRFPATGQPQVNPEELNVAKSVQLGRRQRFLLRTPRVRASGNRLGAPGRGLDTAMKLVKALQNRKPKSVFYSLVVTCEEKSPRERCRKIQVSKHVIVTLTHGRDLFSRPNTCNVRACRVRRKQPQDNPPARPTALSAERRAWQDAELPPFRLDAWATHKLRSRI